MHVSFFFFFCRCSWRLVDHRRQTFATANASFSGELKGEEWDGPAGALAKLLLLDQFPRTAYR